MTCYDSDGDELESSAQRQLHLHSFPLGNSSKIHRAKYSYPFSDSLFILSFKYGVVVSFFLYLFHTNPLHHPHPNVHLRVTCYG